MKRAIIFLSIIFVTGFVLRFLYLGGVPVSLHRDEAFLGYNAYSILKTGRDISGHFLPIHLESFFFSPAGYSYLSIPFIAVFGLNQFSIRFASALFGSLTILLVFLIVLNLFGENKNKYIVALLSSFIFAVSPWHINLSRVAVENTLVLFFLTLGVFIYLAYLKNKKFLLLLLSFLLFGANYLIYQAPRAFLPIFTPFLALCLTNFKALLNSKTQLIFYILIIIAPIFYFIASPNLSWRIQSLSIFSHPETKLVIQEQLTTDAVQKLPTFISRAFHNKVVGFSLLFFDNYFAHLSFDFLFSDGGFPDRFKIPKMGLLYLFELPFIIFAIFVLFKKETKIGFFLSGWILISFIGSALTFDDVPNLQRTLIAAPPISILSGFGIIAFLKTFENKNRLKNVMIVMFSLIGFYNFSYYLIQYYIQGKVYRPWYRQDGYKELVTKVNNLLPVYEKAIITSRESAPTIMFLFYSQYDPKSFQDETKNIDMRKSDHVSFSKYKFSDEECPLRVDGITNKLTGKKGILYVNSSLCKEVPGTKTIAVIKRVDGSEVFELREVE